MDVYIDMTPVRTARNGRERIPVDRDLTLRDKAVLSPARRSPRTAAKARRDADRTSHDPTASADARPYFSQE